MNVFAVTGNLGKDAELRFTPGGDPVCSFNFAFTSGFGEKQKTSWLTATVWGKRAETLAPMLPKGSKVGLVGELTNVPFKDKNGNEKFNLELRVGDLTLLNPKPSTNPTSSENNATPAHNDDMGGNDFTEFEDDIPF